MPEQTRARTCGWKRCRRDATQAHAVWSWFKPTAEQTPTLYDVCDKHAAEFTGRNFDRTRSERVKANATPSLLTDDDARFLRREQARREDGFPPSRSEAV